MLITRSLVPSKGDVISLSRLTTSRSAIGKNHPPISSSRASGFSASRYNRATGTARQRGLRYCTIISVNARKNGRRGWDRNVGLRVFGVGGHQHLESNFIHLLLPLFHRGSTSSIYNKEVHKPVAHDRELGNSSQIAGNKPNRQDSK